MDKKLLLGILIGAVSVPLLVGAALITTSQIADNAVTSKKIANKTIQSYDIADGTITKYQIASGAITGSRIADETINGSKIADNSINSGHLSGSLETVVPDLVTTGYYEVDVPAINAESCTTVDIDIDDADQGQNIIVQPVPIEEGGIENQNVVWSVFSDIDVVHLKLCNVTESDIGDDDIASQYWRITLVEW